MIKESQLYLVYSLNNEQYKGNESKVEKIGIKRKIIRGKDNYIIYIMKNKISIGLVI